MLQVNTIYPVIQGEGILTGTPMILVRFQGCTAGCSWCDTKETWNPEGGVPITPEDLAEQVLEARQGENWILVTGGEPLEQNKDDLITFTETLRYGPSRLQVALETNGAHDVPQVSFDHICVSPKPQLPARPQALRIADEVKVILANGEPVPDWLGQRYTGPNTVILLQPKPPARGLPDRATVQHCIDLARANGYRLSVQLHKLLGLP